MKIEAYYNETYEEYDFHCSFIDPFYGPCMTTITDMTVEEQDTYIHHFLDQDIVSNRCHV